MALPADLQRANFAGTQFLVRSIRTEGGQKTVVHEFPGSDKRNVQELGQEPDSFVVSAIITGNKFIDVPGLTEAKRIIYGENYNNAVNNFKKLLSEGGERDFIHPSQGTFKVKVTTWSLVEDDAEQGIAKFEINFLTSDPQAQPKAATSNVSAVAKRTELVKDDVVEAIKRDYLVTTQAPGNFEDAVNQIFEIGEEFIKNARQFTPNLSELGTFERRVRTFLSNANRLVLDAGILGDSIISLFDSFDQIQLTSAPPTSLARLNRITPLSQLITFFDFGDNDIPNKNNTAGLINRTNNRDTLRLAVQTTALAEAYRESTLVEFQTVDDIENTNATLDDQYQKVKNDIDDETKQELSRLRSEVRKIFDDQRLTVPEVIELDLAILPVTIHAFNLYGNDAFERVDQLIALNDTRDTSTFGGPGTKVLSA